MLPKNDNSVFNLNGGAHARRAALLEERGQENEGCDAVRPPAVALAIKSNIFLGIENQG